MERVHIALAADENYFAGLLVTACSLAEHAAREVELVIHVIDGGIAGESWAKLERKLKALHPQVALDRIGLPSLAEGVVFRSLPVYRGNTMTYARLALPWVLADVEFCIYCDVDFLWLADVAEVWREADPNDLFLGVAEACSDSLDPEETWCAEHSVPFHRDRYVCAGFSFYNLKRALEAKLAERTIEFLQRHPDAPFVDQSAVNAVLDGEVRLLDEKWERLSVALKGVKPRRDFVLHYAGDVPWRLDQPSSVLSDAALLWYRHYARYADITTDEALRKFLSAKKRILGRLYWHLIRRSFTRKAFFALLTLAGHRKCQREMEKRGEKV